MTDGFESNDFPTRWARTWSAARPPRGGGCGPGAASGTSIADSPVGDYGGVESFADLATPLNLTGASGCVVHFTARIALGSGESFFVDRR